MEVSNLRTQLQIMQECLDGIKHSQCQQHQKMCEQLSWFKDHFQLTEILSELHKLTSNTSPIIQVQNNMTQTTPSSSEELCIVSKKAAYYESTRVCRTSFQPQSTPIVNYQLCDTKAVCTEILPNDSSSIHLNVYQKTLPEAARTGQCASIHKNYARSSCCRGRTEDTSSCSTAINANHITSACPVSVPFSQVMHRELLPSGLSSQALSHGDVKLAECQNGSKTKSPCTFNAPEQRSIQKIHHDDKEQKWGPVPFSPKVKYNFGQNMQQDTTMKSNNTGRGGSPMERRKMATRRCCTKRRTYITHSKKKESLTKASDKSKTMRKTALYEPKIKTATQKQTNISEKKVFDNASCERRRYPLEGLYVRDGSWQEHVKKRNYPQQQSGRKEIPKVAKRNLSLQAPDSSQESYLQNGMESEHLLQSWLSPLTLIQESPYNNLPNPLLGKVAQNKTQLNFFDSSDDSD